MKLTPQAVDVPGGTSHRLLGQQSRRLVESRKEPYDTRSVSPKNTPFRLVNAAVLLMAMALSGLSLGLHSKADAVGGPAREATTIYYSEHSRGSGEEHLHAETGSRLALCLACFLSVRDETAPVEPFPTLVSLDTDPATPYSASPVVLAHPGDSFSSRAPPRA